MLQPLIKQTKKNGNGKKIKAAYADGAPARAEKVREAREIGYEGWKDKYKYGNGWAAETFFSGIKRTFGESLCIFFSFGFCIFSLPNKEIIHSRNIFLKISMVTLHHPEI